MKISLRQHLPLLAALLFTTGARQAGASLLWDADFSSYDTSGGPVSLTINSGSLVSDTFSATMSTNVTTPVYEVTTAPGGATNLSGNILHLSGTATTTATTSVGIAETNFPGLSNGGGVLVTSFDVFDPTASVTLQNQADVGTTNRYEGSTFNTTIASSQAFRFTLVVNRTGSTITLPGSLGTLATNSAASYLFDGTNYLNFNSSAGGGSPIVSGFTALESLSSLSAGSSINLYMDNFGAWNSLADTVNGTNILSLAPGTQVVPEPNTALLLLPSAVLLWAFQVRRKGRGIKWAGLGGAS